MVAFIDDHRDLYGVEPICKVIPIAPSTYYAYKARERDASLCSTRAKHEAELCVEVQRAWEANFGVYGVRKVWRQLRREGVEVARCTVARLMQEMGLQGVVRGQRTKTTHSDSESEGPQDLVQRDFGADRPNRLWVSDLTYVAT